MIPGRVPEMLRSPLDAAPGTATPGETALPSSFRVVAAAQASIAVAGLAAAKVFCARSGRANERGFVAVRSIGWRAAAGQYARRAVDRHRG